MARDRDGYVRSAFRRGFAQVDLPSVARRYLKELDEVASLRTRADWVPASVWEVFDRLGMDRLAHLHPYVDELVKAVEERVRLVFAMPPQHGKTTATLVVLLYLLLVQPERRHAYVTYNQSRAGDVYKDFMRMLDRVGIPYDPGDLTVRLRGNKGGVKFTSVDGALTGYTVDGIAVVDDPVKGAQEARSKTVRDNVYRFFTQVLETREMGDLSIVVMMTRWDPDDLSGRLLRRDPPWQYVNITAICDGDDDLLGRPPGAPLWPDAHPLRKLEEFRDNNPREFAAMYQGDPAPEGLRLFNAATTFSAWAPRRSVASYGIDVAYSTKRRSDFSTCVRLVRDLDTGLVVIDRVLRMQGDMRDFCQRVKALQDERDGIVWWATGGSNEHTLVADLLRERGIRRLQCYPARISKRARAQGAADAWNKGTLGWPARLDHQMRDALNEVTHFTGDDRDHDDVVDALASAWKGFQGAAAPLAVGGPRVAHRGPMSDAPVGDPFMDSRAKLALLSSRVRPRSDPRTSAHAR